MIELDRKKWLNGQAMNVLESMKHGSLLNYIAPGLNSSLLGGTQETGKVRVFDSVIEQQQPIAPHSHRYDFACLVLRGNVKNLLWTRTKNPTACLYQCSQLKSNTRLAGCELESSKDIDTWAPQEIVYQESEWYSMKAEEFHSIYFSKDAMVLFFEGPERLESSYVLQPFVNNQVIPTFKIEPWMFVTPGRRVDGGPLGGN